MVVLINLTIILGYKIQPDHREDTAENTYPRQPRDLRRVRWAKP